MESRTLLEHADGQSGILLLAYKKEGKKATMCAPNFDYALADLFCKQLGYTKGQWGRSGDMVESEFISQQ